MNRREFIKSAATHVAGIFLTSTLKSTIPAIHQPVPIPQKRPTKLIVGKNTDYAELVREALQPLGGMKAFVKHGDRVVIKPNIGWNRKPEFGATTHPVIIKTLAELALNSGAGQVIIFDRTCSEERMCYVNSGIQAAIQSLHTHRIKYVFIDSRRFVRHAIPQGKSIRSWEFYQDALDADCYINVPIAKQHGLTKLSLGIKNIMGIVGGNRGKLHHDIGQRLADLHRIFRPHLTVIDATRMLMRNGPQGGNLNDVRIENTVIASRDIVAADAFASTLFGYSPRDIGTTVAAFRSGLGQMNLEKLDIIHV